MSRFGNDRRPAAADEPDTLHGWAFLDVRCPALVLFGVLEQQLEDAAQDLGAVVLGAPTYETFRLHDPGVPDEVRVQALQVEHVGPVWFVHAWTRFAFRTAPAAARAVADLYGVPAAELDAAFTGGP